VTYLLDADTLNYFLKAISPTKERFNEATATGATFVLSLVVHYQITRYLKLKGATRVLEFYSNLVSGWLPVGRPLSASPPRARQFLASRCAFPGAATGAASLAAPVAVVALVHAGVNQLAVLHCEARGVIMGASRERIGAPDVSSPWTPPARHPSDRCGARGAGNLGEATFHPAADRPARPDHSHSSGRPEQCPDCPLPRHQRGDGPPLAPTLVVHARGGPRRAAPRGDPPGRCSPSGEARTLYRRTVLPTDRTGLRDP
jgi:hypothetical protein